MYMCIYIVCIYVTLLVFLMFYHIVVPQKLFTFFFKKTKAQGTNRVCLGM